jgi:YfiH family protein
MGFIEHQRGDIKYFTIEAFDKTGLVRHCFTTKHGGFSSGLVSGLNLGFLRPDSRENVMKNFTAICDAIGFNIENLVLSHQVHGTDIRRVGIEDRGKGITRVSDIKNVDGLITKDSGVALTTFHADCVPLFFLDPVRRCIGLAHAGWRGTVAGIAKEAVDNMTDQFGTEPDKLLVGIGPSICKDCYEVDAPVISQLRARLSSWDHVTVYKGLDKYLVDLKQVNKMILLEAGVTEQNITISELCTRCRDDLFYSYRRQGANFGSLAAIMELVV